MNAWIIQSWLRLRSSYYFLPSLMCLVAIILALLTTIIDLRYQAEVRDLLGWFFASTVVSARSVLTTIAASMISVAAVTFSLTMVAVTTASGQYGPRLIGNFMRDRANQITLGTFVSTFLYCIVVLKSVSEEITIDAQSTVGLSPSLSVMVALILTLISVGVLIFFVHHIPETLNVGTLTGKVAKTMIRQIRTGRFPTHSGLDTITCDPNAHPFDPTLSQRVRSRSSGYVQAVSLKGLLEYVEKSQLRVRLLHVPGDFIIQGSPIMEVISDDQSSDFDREEFDSKTFKDLMSFIATGRERTEHQNLLFPADELVEISARALSPGISDPFTAINCIHWFGDICIEMMDAPETPDCILDSQGTPRIWAKSVDFGRLCDALFGQLRQYASADENASRELLRILYQLKDRASSAMVKPIDRQIETLHEAIQQSSLREAQKARLRDGPPYRY